MHVESRNFKTPLKMLYLNYFRESLNTHQLLKIPCMRVVPLNLNRWPAKAVTQVLIHLIAV